MILIFILLSLERLDVVKSLSSASLESKLSSKKITFVACGWSHTAAINGISLCCCVLPSKTFLVIQLRCWITLHLGEEPTKPIGPFCWSTRSP